MRLSNSDSENVVVEFSRSELLDLRKIVSETSRIDPEVLLVEKYKINEVISFLERSYEEKGENVVESEIRRTVFADLHHIVGTADAIDAYPEMSIRDGRIEKLYLDLEAVWKQLATPL